MEPLVGALKFRALPAHGQFHDARKGCAVVVEDTNDLLIRAGALFADLLYEVRAVFNVVLFGAFPQMTAINQDSYFPAQHPAPPQNDETPGHFQPRVSLDTCPPVGLKSARTRFKAGRSFVKHILCAFTARVSQSPLATIHDRRYRPP